MVGEVRPTGPPGEPPSDDGDPFGALPAGTGVGKYEIVELLGQGGFGITYRARDSQLRRDVAIKEYLPTSFAVRRANQSVLPRSTHTAEDFLWGRERFLDEARTLATLEDAPGIVNVHDFLEANGTAYMVMALVRGETLEAKLKRDRRLQQPGIEHILYPLLDGLERVHDAGFLHRDIKPANILLDASGRPTLIDFGASRQALTGRTQVMTAVYTASYAAFEQMGSGKQGPWTDIYALAGTLYHCMAGMPPPPVLDRMAEDTLIPAVEFGKGRYAPTLLATIDAGLRLRASDRPQSIAEWRRVLAGMSSSGRAVDSLGAATRVSSGEAPPRPAGTPSSQQSAVGTGATQQPPGATEQPAAATSQSTTSAPAQAAAAPHSRHILPWIVAGVLALALVAGGAWIALRPAPETPEQALRRIEDEARRQTEIAMKLRQDQEAAEARRKAEEDRALKESKAKAFGEAAERQRIAEAEARRKADEDAARKAAEEKAAADAATRRKADEDAARKAAEEKAVADAAARKRAEEEATRKQADEKAAAEAAERQRIAEAEAKRKAEQDAARKAAEDKAAADAATRRKTEEEAARKQAEEKATAETAERQRVAEAEARRKAEQDAARKAAEEKAAAEAAERQRLAEVEAKRKAEQETARKAAEEKAAADAARRTAEQEAARKQAEEKAAAQAAERQRLAEAEAKRKAEAEATRLAAEKAKAEAAARDKEEAEARRKAEAEAKRAAEDKARAEAEARRPAEATEAALRLPELDRKRVQVALTSLGHDTRGSDGAFGPRTRQMIAAWQKSQNAPETGYLTATQVAALMQQAALALARFEETHKKAEEEKRKAEEEAKRKAEEEARRKTEEEARRKAEADRKPAPPAVKPTPAPAPTATPGEGQKTASTADQQKIDARPLGTVGNPIRVNGVAGENAYVQRLVCANGTKPETRRLGPRGVGPYGTPINAYDLECDELVSALYFDPNHPGYTEARAPRGFTLR